LKIKDLQNLEIAKTIVPVPYYLIGLLVEDSPLERFFTDTGQTEDSPHSVITVLLALILAIIFGLNFLIILILIWKIRQTNLELLYLSTQQSLRSEVTEVKQRWAKPEAEWIQSRTETRFLSNSEWSRSAVF